jgi:[ribosomal protein S18]-alanine N-acetyltransferase
LQGGDLEVGILIRDFTPDDAAAILDIQHTALQSAQWQASDYERLSREAGGMILVAREASDPAIIGFLAGRVLGEEAELYNLAVGEAHRRRGAGKCLIQEFHRRLVAEAVARVGCEVRASNVPALDLYGLFGYVRSGLRRNYYASDGEDAVLLQCDLRASGASAMS